MDEKALKAAMVKMAVPIEKHIAGRVDNSRKNVVVLATHWWRQAVVIHQWFGVPIETACKAVALYKATKDSTWAQAYSLLVNQSPDDLSMELRFNPGVTSRDEAGEAIAIAGAANVWKENLGMDAPLTLGNGDAERILLDRWPTYAHPLKTLGELAPPIGSPENNQKKP